MPARFFFLERIDDLFFVNYSGMYVLMARSTERDLLGLEYKLHNQVDDFIPAIDPADVMHMDSYLAAFRSRVFYIAAHTPVIRVA